MASKTAKKGDVSLEKKYKKQPWRRYLWLLWLLVIVPLVYIAVQLFIIMLPRFQFERALKEEMTESIIVQGVVSLTSIPVRLEAQTGALYYTVPIGERVSSGTAIAEVYTSGEAADARVALEQIDKELVSLQAAQKILVDSGDVDIYRKQLQNGIYDLLNSVNSNNFSLLEGPKAEVTLAFNKLQIATGEVVGFEDRINALAAKKDELAHFVVPTSIISATETGYFVPAIKYDAIVPKYETLAGYSPMSLQTNTAKAQSYHPSDIIGHVVTDYKWRFFTVVTEKEAERFVVGDKSMQIRFPDVNDKTLPIRVDAVTIDETTGMAKLEFFCEYISPEIMQMRVEKAQIIFRTEHGIRIPSEALRIIDGVKGVYIRFGNISSFRPITIILENEDYLLVSDVYTKNENEVLLFDEIIVGSGGVELYDGRYL